MSWNPAQPPSGDALGRILERLVALERRLLGLERAKPTAIVVEGPRSDLTGNRGPRVQMGLLTDGTYGIERWSSTGVRQTPTWS